MVRTSDGYPAKKELELKTIDGYPIKKRMAVWTTKRGEHIKIMIDTMMAAGDGSKDCCIVEGYQIAPYVMRPIRWRALSNQVFYEEDNIPKTQWHEEGGFEEWEYFGHRVEVWEGWEGSYPWKFRILASKPGERYQWIWFAGIPNKCGTRRSALKRAWYRCKWLSEGRFEEYYES